MKRVKLTFKVIIGMSVMFLLNLNEIQAQESEFFPPSSEKLESDDPGDKASDESLFFQSDDSKEEAEAPTVDIFLPRGLIRKIDQQILPALRAQNSWALNEHLSPLIATSTPDQVEAIEAYVKTKGFDDLLANFVDAKIQLIEQGSLQIGQRQPLAVTIYTIRGINQRVQAFIDQVNNHVVMKDPLKVDDNWRDNRNGFWQTHVFKNEFSNNNRLLEFASALLESAKKTIRNSVDPSTREVVSHLERMTAELPKLHFNVVEREAEMRLQRFRKSNFELLKNDLDFEQRFIAAICIELDAEMLTPLLKNPPRGGFTRNALNHEGLQEEIETAVAAVRSSEDGIAEKAILFRSGLHSWLRGRYGKGTLKRGLLKPSKAMKSEQVMNAIYMPKVRPKPISLFHGENETSEGCDRRHFYTWSVEDRPLISGVRNTKKTRVVSQTRSKTEFEHRDFFW